MAMKLTCETPGDMGEARFHDRKPAPGAIDRRAVPRFAVELDVDVHTSHNFYEGVVRDLGVAGVFVATFHNHAVGELIELHIRLPDGGQPIGAIGEVRWTRAYSEKSETEPGMGLLFRSISTADRARIANFLKYREPLLYDE
jgi:uncharacterized protein (TIGR02266 family)